MVAVLIVGLLMNAIALPLAAKRVLFLYSVISSGQPAPDRIKGVTGRLGAAIKRQVVEVFGQKKLLKWSVPGAAHFFVFWAFLILATVYLEAYGSLFKILFTGGEGPMDWAIPIVGHWAVLGFLQDFIAMMAFFGILTFVWIRVKQAPENLGRRSRFFGSHLSGAWITLFMIFNVIWTMFLFRGASAALGNLPYKDGAFISIGVGKAIDGLTHEALEVLEGIGLLLHIGVMLVFLIFVLNSKHLHIFLAPLNVLFGRDPVALGAAKPMMSAGKPLTLDDLEDLDEDTTLGVGSAEDFSWKGVLDMTTCTECGRCQDQCPAWNTEKPLSPKLLIMALRDHTIAKAPYLLADEDDRDRLLEKNEKVAKEVERPLVGDTGDDWFYMPEDGSGVIDPDVLWSCVTCGACVQQCPVDIEHVDHIVDMRRYQVLVESNFPAELNGLFKGLESKGNPWNMSATARLDWAKDLPFEVKVVGEDIESLDDVEWLFWVGCAGAYEDRAKKTTRAVAELLDMAGVSFGVLGNGETCTGDSARRAGNEFVYQGLAAQNVETFKEYKVKKAVTTCAHCFNTLKNEYRQLGIELEVVHHTQLLNRLVREKKLTPVSSNGGGDKRSITYHDPCYIGRHNGVYSPPRELLNVLPDAEFTEMPRNSERSFCCGAGGARMWMEENIGSRINETRTLEAVGTGADQIAVGCPFCRVMLSDGLTAAQSKGDAREEVEVLDVAQMLLASVKGESGSKAAKKAVAASEAKASGAGSGDGGATATATIEREETADTADSEATKAEPEADDATQTEDTVSDTEDVGAAAKASGGGSLFDLGDDESGEPEEKPAAEPKSEDTGEDVDRSKDDADTDVAPDEDQEAKPEAEEKKADASDEGFGGGSLFDVGGDESEDSAEEAEQAEPEQEPEDKAEPEDQAEPKAEPEPEPEPEAKSEEAESSDEGFGGGSLFDIGDASTEEPEQKPAAEPKAEDTGENVDRSEDDADTDVGPEADQEAEDKAEPEDKAEDKTEPEAEDKAEPEEKADEEVQETSASSGTASTPSAEIPEGGSLFDIEAPAEEEVSRPAPAADEAPADTEDAAADSTTDGEVDRSEDDADTDVEPETDEAPDEEAEDRDAADDNSAEDKSAEDEGGEEESDGSTDTDEVEEKSADDSEAAPLTSLRDIKAKYSGESTETDAEADESADQAGEADETDAEATQAAEETDASEESVDEPEDDADEEDESEESDEQKPKKPAASGDTHQPRTDAEIGEGGSLFDI